jgi:alpha-D-xyloside xylohydrolase
VPWAYDDEACDVLRHFTKLKCRLMPYLFGAAVQAHLEGIPVMRAMTLEFPSDPACDTLDRQYMLGGSLLVAPVFTEDGSVDYYLPEGRWTHLLTGEAESGGRWHRARHGVLSLPLFVRPGAVIPLGAVDARPDYEYSEGLTFRVYELGDGQSAVCAVPDRRGGPGVDVTVRRDGNRIRAEWGGAPASAWKVEVYPGGASASAAPGARSLEMKISET